jgi:uncharacterized protein YuzE
MTVTSPIFYDPSTDSMYVRFHNVDAYDQRVDDERDLVIDLDETGRVVGYDIQHASRHMDVVAEALLLLRETPARAA